MLSSCPNFTLWDQSQLQGCVTCVTTQDPIQKAPTLVLMLQCCHPGILNKISIRGPSFSFCPEPSKLLVLIKIKPCSKFTTSLRVLDHQVPTGPLSGLHGGQEKWDFFPFPNGLSIYSALNINHCWVITTHRFQLSPYGMSCVSLFARTRGHINKQPWRSFSCYAEVRVSCDPFQFALALFRSLLRASTVLGC